MDHPTSGAHADAHPIYETRLEGGKHWSLTVRGGTQMRLVDLEGGANVGMLLFNPCNVLERYNAPDTLKCQHTFKLTRGHCLYSDMGRIFCSIVEDTAGWHDTVCGNSNRALVQQRWGLKSYQQCRNDWHQNGHDAFLVEGGKYGLGRRDLAANVNWFSKVSAEETGVLSFDPQACASTCASRWIRWCCCIPVLTRSIRRLRIPSLRSLSSCAGPRRCKPTISA